MAETKDEGGVPVKAPRKKKRPERATKVKRKADKTKSANAPAKPKKPKAKKGKKAVGLPVSPLAPERFPDMPSVSGVVLGTAATGLKYKGRDDLLFVILPDTTTVAGVFTQSATAAAPVEWCRSSLADGRARALVVNAGNANAFTGRAGPRAVRATAASAASVAGCRQKDVMVASTGVIGEELPSAPLVSGIEAAAASSSASAPDGWEAAARAITTTDTFPKGASRTARIGDTLVTINGIAKGSGMIAPDMATMLAFIFTNAAIPAPVLQTLLLLDARETFNSITVDGDTSTNDTLLAFATGAAMADEVDAPTLTRPGDPRLRDFRRALKEVMLDLAHQLVRDGEGATKFVEIHVNGAASVRAARQVAFTIANSPLVKTAIAGEDANWGRVVMAAGRSGVEFDQARLSVAFGGIPIAASGAAVPEYDEAPVARHMKGKEIRIDLSLGGGRGAATVWTCDLSHGYVSINADYRT